MYFGVVNELVKRICSNFRYDSQTSDVRFVFQNPENSSKTIVEAHKNLLLAGSPVFRTMFYGSLPEKGDILIEDVSSSAFRDFLQFFYCTEFSLSSDHVFKVAYLCHKYGLFDALRLCENPIISSLTIRNICSGYAQALLLDMEAVINFCEQKIKQKAPEILDSADFLKCDQKILGKIIQLVAPKCNASVIVDACMDWAKAKCERDNLKDTPENLKAQLKDLINLIPFDELDLEQSTSHTKTYKRFFVEDKLEAIISKTFAKKAKPDESKSSSRILDCVRGYSITARSAGCELPSTTSFTSNTQLLLKKLYVAKFIGFGYNISQENQ